MSTAKPLIKIERLDTVTKGDVESLFYVIEYSNLSNKTLYESIVLLAFNDKKTIKWSKFRFKDKDTFIASDFIEPLPEASQYKILIELSNKETGEILLTEERIVTNDIEILTPAEVTSNA